MELNVTSSNSRVIMEHLGLNVIYSLRVAKCIIQIVTNKHKTHTELQIDPLGGDAKAIHTIFIAVVDDVVFTARAVNNRPNKSARQR